MVTQEELEKMSPEEIAELQKQNCPFCKIVSGDIPSSKVYDDSDMIAILDINPAKKGHVLLLPKQHVPIMPIIPPPVFKKLFSTAKLISKSIKKAMLVPYTSLFIANGAVAGQQAAHFLFHIVPREKGDGLSNFDIKPNDDFLKDQESLFSSLKNNLTLMMANHAKREGKSYDKKPSSSSSNSSSSQTSSPEDAAILIDKKREQIAAILESNPPVKDLLMNDPEEFKKQLAITPQLQPLFEGVDIDALSKGLQELPSVDSADSNSSQDEIENELNVETTEKVKSKSESSDDGVTSVVEENGSEIIQENSVPVGIPQRKPEVFLGADPLAQKNKVFAYFDSKPLARELLMDDLPRFKELLSGREDVQEIFKDVNLDKLSEKLIEAREYEREQNTDVQNSSSSISSTQHSTQSFTGTNESTSTPVTTTIDKTNLPDKSMSLEDALGGDSNE